MPICLPAVQALVYKGRATREAKYRASRGLAGTGVTFARLELMIDMILSIPGSYDIAGNGRENV